MRASALRSAKAYLRRYIRDLVSFAKAFALALLGAFPLASLTFGLLFFPLYLVVALVGALHIVVFSPLTSIFDNYAYKFLIFMLAVLWVLYAFQGQIGFDPSGIEPGAINVIQLVVYEILFLFPLFYFLLEWAEWRRRRKVSPDSAYNKLP